MPDAYHVRIEKERLVFSVAHFITYGDDVCEPIHGHNYHVSAEVFGPLEENGYVVDFIVVRDALQKIVDALDHRVILPTEHPTIHVAESHGENRHEVVATHGRRRWIFPLGDCVLLPLANTTAELLAKFVCERLRELLDEAGAPEPAGIQISVDECDGQWGVYRWAPAR